MVDPLLEAFEDANSWQWLWPELLCGEQKSFQKNGKKHKIWQLRVDQDETEAIVYFQGIKGKFDGTEEGHETKKIRNKLVYIYFPKGYVQRIIRRDQMYICKYTIYHLHFFPNKSLHHHQHICHTLTPHPVFFHIEAPFPAPSSNTALPCSIARARDVAKCAMRTTAGGHVESPVGSWENDESLEWLLIC